MSSCKCCCKRYNLLYNMKEATVDEVKSFLNGLFRLYVFMTILNILNAWTVRRHSSQFISAIFGTLLYLGNTVALRYTSTVPTNCNTIWAIVFAAMLCVFNCAITIFFGIQDHNPWMVLYAFSIAVQLTTVYIHHQLRIKMLDTDSLIFGDGSADVKTPLTHSGDMNM